MDVPHQRYILHLCAQGLTPMEVATECRKLRLSTLSVADIKKVLDGAGGIPDYVEPTLGASNARMFRWLRDRGILCLWRPDPVAEEMMRLVRNISVRKAADLLLICGIFDKSHPIQEVRDNLKTRFAAGTIPSLDALNYYVQIFFDLSCLTYEARESLVEKGFDEAALEAFRASATGDLSLLYSHLGLVNNFSESEMLNQIVRFNTRQLALADSSGKLHSGQSQAGIATLQKILLEANDRLALYRERHAPKTDMGTKAKAWKIANPAPRTIRQFDDVMAEDDGGYVDVESADEQSTAVATRRG